MRIPRFTLGLLLGVPLVAFSQTLPTPTLPTPDQVIAGWTANADPYLERIRGTNSLDREVAINGLTAQKTADIQLIVVGSETTAAGTASLSQFFNKVSAYTPEVLNASDFQVTMLDPVSNNEAPLVDQATKNRMVAVRPDLATALLITAASDDEACQLIGQYGVMDAFCSKLASSPSWTKSIKAACLHIKTATHMTWRRLLPVIADDTLRLQLVNQRADDKWLLLAAYATARTPAFKQQLAPKLAAIGIDVTTLYDSQNLAADTTWTTNTAVQQANAGERYWKNHYNGDDDDDKRAAIGSAFSQMRSQSTAFATNLAALNDTLAGLSATDLNNYKSTDVRDEVAWHLRNITGSGIALNTAAVYAMASDPEKRSLVIEQGTAETQLALVKACQTQDGTTLLDDELTLLCSVARNNQVVQQISKIPNLQSKVRVSLIQNLRHDSQALAILNQILDVSPANALEARALVRGGATPDIFTRILKTAPTADVVRELAACDYLQIIRKCVQTQPQDLPTLQNALGQMMAIAANNDTATRDAIVASPNYPSLYQQYHMETTETLATQANTIGQTMISTGQDGQSTSANFGTTLKPSIIYFNGPYTSSSYQMLLATSDSLYGPALTTEMASSLNPTNFANINPAFWPKPAGASDPIANLASQGMASQANATSSQTLMSTTIAQQSTAANTSLGTMVSFQSVTLDDGTRTNIALTTTTNSTLFSDLQTAAAGNPSTTTTTAGLPTAANQTKLNQANAHLMAALDAAYATTAQAAEADRTKQQARQIAAQNAVKSGNLSNLGLQSLIDQLDQCNRQAAQEKAAWLDRTDLSYVNKTHPYFTKADLATKGTPEIVVTTRSDQSQTRVLRAGNDEIPEYVSTQTVVFDVNGNPTYATGQTQNPRWDAALAAQGGHAWRYTSVVGTTRTPHIDYYQFLNDQWQIKYYGTNANTIPVIQQLISQREHTTSTAELSQALEDVNRRADQDKLTIQNLNPSKIYQGTPAFAHLSPDLLQSGYIRSDVIANRNVQYFDLFQYEADQWSAKYLGNRPGTPDYYRALLMSK